MTIANIAATAKIYDLGQPYYVGMPHFPTHPPYLFTLTKLHGELSRFVSESASRK